MRLLTASLLGALAFLTLRGNVLVVRSDSMRPAMAAGDLVVHRQLPAGRLGVGDVVTVPGRGGTVTHRVQRVVRTGGQIEVTTRGDANTGVERSVLADDARVRVAVARVPFAGRFVLASRAPLALGALAAGAGLLVRRRRDR